MCPRPCPVPTGHFTSAQGKDKDVQSNVGNWKRPAALHVPPSKSPGLDMGCLTFQGLTRTIG